MMVESRQEASTPCVRAGEGCVRARAGATVTVAWSLIKCAGMICNEYIAHKLEGVRQAVELCVCGGGSDDPSVAQGDPGEWSS